jgi:hypothetical protein
MDKPILTPPIFLNVKRACAGLGDTAHPEGVFLLERKDNQLRIFLSDIEQVLKE